MKKSTSIFLFSVILNLFGCNDAPTTNRTAHHSVDNADVTGFGGKSVNDSSHVVKNEIVNEPNVSNNFETNQSTSNLVTYQVGDWAVGASQLWEAETPPINQVKLYLVNKQENLIFSVLVEEVQLTQNEYANAQAEFLKKLNLPNTTVKQVGVNGTNYSLIESPASNFNNWQWVFVENNVAYVWSCGGPKDSKVNFESCLTVMTTAQK